jgi:hypothetical protein
LISMISPFLASAGSFSRGFSAIISSRVFYFRHSFARAIFFENRLPIFEIKR